MAACASAAPAWTSTAIETAQHDDHRVIAFPSRFGSEDPAAAAARAQVRRLLEGAIDALPEPFRIVFIMRDVEGCSVEETASSLEIRAETVKTRLHRARRLLRAALQDSLAATLGDAFPFLGPRCARMTEAVLARLDGMRRRGRPCSKDSRNSFSRELFHRGLPKSSRLKPLLQAKMPSRLPIPAIALFPPTKRGSTCCSPMRS